MRTFLWSMVVGLVVSSCAHHREQGEHPKLGGAVKSLHDAISPAYHQEKGPSRDEQTCAALPKMKEASSAVAAERTADEAKNAAMTQALAGLETACQANGRPEVAAKFEAVHEAFHAYMEGEKH